MEKKTIVFHCKRDYEFNCYNCKKKEIYVENVYDEKSFTSLEEIEKTVSKINDLGYSAKVGFLCEECQSKFNNKKAFFEIEYDGKVKSGYNSANKGDYFIIWEFLGRCSKHSNDIDCLTAILNDWSTEDHDYVKNVLKQMLGLKGIKRDNIVKRLINSVKRTKRERGMLFKKNE